MIASPLGTIFATVYTPTTGHPDFQHAYRSEAQASTASILFITHYCKFHNLKTPPIKYYCDNEALIKKLQCINPILHKASDGDILQYIYENKPTTMTPSHVYGHQDRVKHALILPEYLNTLADSIATNNTSIPIQIHPPNENSVYLNNQFIPNHYTKILRKYCYRKEAVTYLQRKYKWSNETLLTIHWESHEENLKHLP